MLTMMVVDLAGGTAVYLSTARASYLAVYANWNMEDVEGMKEQIQKEDLLICRLRLGDSFDGRTMLPK